MATALGACALVLGLTAQADAKDLTFPSVDLGKSKGYSGFVSSSEKGDEITVSVSNKKGNASYKTKGKASGKKIKAKFKGFGKISLKFVAKGKAETNPPPDGCRGPKSESQEGSWVGKVSFKGENGYVKFDGKRFDGSVFTRPDKDLDCDFDPPPTGNEKPCTFANGNLATSEGEVFVSGRMIEGKPPEWTANINSEKNGVSVSRFATAKGGALTANNEAQTGSVSPPSPFSGSGTIADNTLSGDLKVELPGATVSLSGKEWFVSEGTCS